MQTVILAGGSGSRLAEGAELIPKPLVEVGGRPIINHVMDIFARFGHKDFIVAAGYKSFLLKQFFADYHLIANDVSISLDDGTMTRAQTNEIGRQVSVVDTGQMTMTSGRLRRVAEWINGETFLCAYSDGVGNVDIDALVDFHRSHGKLATITAVQPLARLGSLQLDGSRVADFSEVAHASETWINGGFFVFDKGVLDYFVDDNEPLERKPLAQMARDGQLMAYKHSQFWHPMDTVRDRDNLDKLSETDVPPWLDFSHLELPRVTAAE